MATNLISNGDFSDATYTDTSVHDLVGWDNTDTHDATNKFTISGGECRVISDGTLTTIKQTILEAGKRYVATVDITDVTAGGIAIGSTGNSKNLTTVGSHSFNFIANVNGFIVKRVGEADVTFDNVVVTEATYVDISDTSGTSYNMIINGDFDTDENWATGTGWSIGNGVASCDGSASIFETDTWESYEGKVLELSFEVTAYTSGTLSTGGNSSFGTEDLIITGIGTYTLRKVANAQTRFYLYSPNFIGSIDNLTITNQSIETTEEDFEDARLSANDKVLMTEIEGQIITATLQEAD